MTDLLEFFGAVYLCVGFAKFMLCVPHIPRVIGVLSRLSGAPKGVTLTRYIFVVPFLVAGVSFFMWVSSLYHEGVRFFVMYSNRAVTRDCVRAYREAHAGD